MKLMNIQRFLVLIPLFVLSLVALQAAATEPTVEPLTANNSVTSSYLLGPGDQLSISVWKEEGMDLQVLVKPDGGISFPLAGEVQASGLTTDQLREVLVKKLTRYIPNPIITVSVLQSVSNKVYVIGKVNRPGEFVATGYLDVLQALTLAGGVTAFADSDEIKVIRRSKDGTKVFAFDYGEVVSGERLDMNILLKAGDTVVVP